MSEDISNGRSVIHAHDQFVRGLLSDMDIAREFSSIHLPPAIELLSNLE